jgi:hypothetical protein
VKHLDEFAILTCQFNPVECRRTIENYFLFKAALGPLADRLYSAEVAFDGHDFQTDAQLKLRASDGSRLWLKEWLLNLLLRQLPEQVRYVAWIDRDIVFHDPSWPQRAAELLDGDCAMVQLFSAVRFTGPAGETMSIDPGFAYAAERGGMGGSAKPGGAWAARRDYLSSVELPSMNIVGGADSNMAIAWTGGTLSKLWDRHGYAPGLRTWNQQWADRALAAMNGRRCGYVPGMITHLWHRDSRKAGSSERHVLLQKAGFDPTKHIRVNSDGLPELHHPALADQIRQYFSSREEGRQASYGEARERYKYLATAINLVRGLAGGPRLLEVGGGVQRGCKYLERLPAFERTVVEKDQDRGIRLPGVRCCFGRFEDWPVDGRYDVALCLQTLEHVDDPKAFASKLFACAPVVVLSVPYLWPEGGCPGHLHDPIDEAKLASWVGRKPDHVSIARDQGCARLVAAYVQ